MKQGSVLVNIARGSVVDEKALYDAIKSGHLLGAGLDVLEQDPGQPDNSSDDVKVAVVCGERVAAYPDVVEAGLD